MENKPFLQFPPRKPAHFCAGGHEIALAQTAPLLNGDTGAVAQLTAEYLELFSSKGIYLVLTDIDDANHRMEKWFENDTLFKTAQKHHKYLVINSKSTSSSGYNTVFWKKARIT